jgi:DNA-binding response OmpR family regulator
MLEDRPVLLLDRNVANHALVADALATAGLPARALDSLEALDEALGAGAVPGAALVDPAGFGPRLRARLQVLAQRRVPVALLAARDHAGLRLEAARLGASAVLVKPLRRADLVATVRAMLGAEG